MKTRWQSVLFVVNLATCICCTWLLGAWFLTGEMAVRTQAAGVVSTLNTLVLEGQYTPIAGSHQKLTALDTKQVLTVPTRAVRCLFYAEDDACRWNDDGTDPDPATKVGGVIPAGDYFLYNGHPDAIELKGSATTILHVWYYAR